MARRPSTAVSTVAAAIRAQVLRGIAGNRVAGLHFPGYFMDMAWPRVASDTVQLALADGPHCRDANGTIDVAALAILADTALATTARTQTAPGARLATLARTRACSVSAQAARCAGHCRRRHCWPTASPYVMRAVISPRSILRPG